MNKRFVIMLLMALILAGGAAMVANNWLQNQGVTAESSQQGMVTVAAAAIAIPYGQKLALEHIKMVELPEKSVPEGAYRIGDELEGMIASQAIVPGEVILKGRVVEHLGGSTLSAVIEPGMRAVAVRVNEIIGVAGFLLPGNRVDVLASRKGGNRGVAIETILQDIKVLAVDQTSSTDKNEPVVVRAVTLEVTPKQAEMLVKATGEGSVQLALRNPKDEQQVIAEDEKVAAAQPAPKPAKRPYYAPKITMIRGTDVTTVTVK